jgi:hypothetical protein
MLRGQKVFFRASKADLDRLYACNREFARVWNECHRLAKEHFLQHGRWITKSELQKQTKRNFHLHSQSIQAVSHQYSFARQAAHQASNKDILPAIPTRKRSISQQNGRKAASKCMKTEKSNSPWAFIMENGKSQSSCMCRICQKERSKKLNAAWIKVFIWP